MKDFIKLTSNKTNFYVYLRPEEVMGIESYVPPSSDLIEVQVKVEPYCTVMTKSGHGFQVKETAEQIMEAVHEALWDFGVTYDTIEVDPEDTGGSENVH